MNNKTIYSQALELTCANRVTAIQTVLSGAEGEIGRDLKRTLISAEVTTDKKGNPICRAGYREEGGQIVLSEPVFPRERLILLGGGHVALPLYEMAVRCDFRVVVCDDRQEFACRERFPLAEEVLCGTFEDSLESLRVSPYDFVVIITRGHAHDRDCLRAILQGGEPVYTGMIGSRRKVRGILEQMEREGFPKSRLDRICAPIGLPIGAVTPEEIAVSILSELISYRRLGERRGGRPCLDSDLSPEMMEYLAADENPKAIVTVMGTEGSTPRGAGARMAVGRNGETVGTIGGGGGEGAIIREAARIIGTGRYKVCEIDMTGEVAAEEGLVCGGRMKVLIEDGESRAE